MPLPTTFAGVSARGEGLFALVASSIPTGSHIYYPTANSNGQTFTWTAPTGVTSVSVVCVGSGGGIDMSSYTGSYFSSTSVCYATSAQGIGSPAAGTAVAGTGFSGGIGHAQQGGGGGAAGYTSNGGDGANGGISGGFNGSSSTDGGGGGGSSSYTGSTKTSNLRNGAGGGGGGVDLYGSGSGGTGGTGGNVFTTSGGGGGGSGGGSGGYGNTYNANGANGSVASSTYGRYGSGATYVLSGTTYYGGGGGGGAFGGGGGSSLSSGGGGGLAYANNISVTPGNTYTVYVSGALSSSAGGAYASGGSGGVRIVWPGTTRQFPSTNVSTTTNEVVN